MSDSPRDDQAAEHANAQRGLPSRTGTPRWVKVFAAVGAILIVLLVVVLLLTGGRHGPARHLPSGEGRDTEAPKATPQRRGPAHQGEGHRPPQGAH